MTAQPNGKLTDAEGSASYCLFWESVYGLSSGFAVAGEDTEAFLEDALAQLGLNAREANEFIIYWLPRMEHNAYNLISFQQELYAENATLTIVPEPDSLLRVFMAWQALEEPVEVEPQTLPSFRREGFAVMEGGGAEIREKEQKEGRTENLSVRPLLMRF